MKKIIFSLMFLSVFIAVQAQVNKTEVLQGLEKGQPANQDQLTLAKLKVSGRLFNDKNDLTSVILVIPAGDTVEVLDRDSTYFHVHMDRMRVTFINGRLL